jgi:hypothetical protein
MPATRPPKRTPASKYIAITLWSLAGFVAAFIVQDGIAHRDGARYGIMTSLFGIPIASGLFAIPGYIAWMLYKSATSRPLRGLTIAKRASAALSALVVSAFMLGFVAMEVESDYGWVMLSVIYPLLLLPLSVISLGTTVVLYIVDAHVKKYKKSSSLVPSSLRTAVYLWSVAGTITGIAIFIESLLSLFFAALFAIGGLVAWMTHKSKSRR